jgi:eukaryotic-like serine/threonine-protein kinase
VAEQFKRLSTALAGRYRIERELGAGATATVYLARDLKHDRQVAIKVLKPELAAAIGPERFLREIKITAQLNHPHILPLLDSGVSDDFLYYVMPYVAGESIRDRLNREKQLAVDDAVRITRNLVAALTYAHGVGVIHRDIKPENVLLAGDHAVLADFGIARAISAAGGEKLTETGLVVGTPAYMSPEQASGERELDGRSDIYSLACLLYEMLAGTPPFVGPSAQAILARHSMEAVPSLRTVRASVGKTLEAAITRAMSKVPADRYATAAQFGAALGEAGSAPARLPRGKRVLGYLGALVVLALLTVFAISRVSRGPTLQEAHTPRIVVLPFENLGQAKDEYFADGITEEITSRLARLPGLGVIARTSAIRYKDTQPTIRQIGEDLDVDYVLEGSVRWDKSDPAESRVRVTPQLIRVSDETHVWAPEPYEAALVGIFQLQAAVAERVAQALDVTLLASDRQALGVSPTTNLEAYDLYLLGRHHLSTGMLDRAIEDFQRAIARDSGYARAYGGLALVYSIQPAAAVARPQDVFPKAEAAALQAIKLDSTVAEGFLALGVVEVNFDRNLEAADREFRRAIRLDPNDAEAHVGLAHALILRGRAAEARDAMERAQRLDPFSLQLAVDASLHPYIMGEYDEALEASERVLALDSTYGPAYFFLGKLHYRRGEIAEARTAWKAGGAWLGADPGWEGAWERVLDRLDEPERASQALNAWLATNPRPINWLIPAMLYELFGDHERALDWLERGYEAWYGEASDSVIVGPPPIFIIGPFPDFDGLWNDPRYITLMRKVGLAQYRGDLARLRGLTGP